MVKVKRKKSKKSQASAGKPASLWYSIIIAVLAIGLYSNTLNHGYVLDDISVISGNRFVQQGLDGIKDIWTTSYREGYWNDSGTLYRPLTLTAFALEWQFSPDNPTFAHWINVLCYALLCVLLFRLVKALTTNENVAFLTAVLFAVCTVHTEVVANIKSFDEILSMTLGVLAWLLTLRYHESNSKQQLVLAGIVFLAGMFTKEGLVAFMAVIPLSLWFFRSATIKQAAFSALPLAGAVGVYLLARANVLGGITATLTPSAIDNPMVNYTLAERLTTGIELFGMYIQKLFIPAPLAYEYAYNTLEMSSFADPGFWLGLILIVGMLFIAVKGLKGRSIWAFCALYFLITIALYTNLIVMIGAMFAERFLFFASLGWALALAFAISKLKTKTIQFAVLGGLTIVYGGMTFARNPVWESSYSLYAADIETLEESAKAHYNLGLEIMKEKAMKTNNQAERKQLLMEALKSFERSLQIKPGYQLPKAQIALVHYRLGNYAEAIERYQEVLEKNPNDDSGWNNLAGALVATNQLEGALECYQKAIDLNPYYTDALGNCGAVNGMLGRHEEAIKYLLRAVELAPRNASYHQYIGLSYQALGDQARADQYLQQAKALKQ